MLVRELSYVRFFNEAMQAEQTRNRIDAWQDIPPFQSAVEEEAFWQRHYLEAEYFAPSIDEEDIDDLLEVLDDALARAEMVRPVGRHARFDSSAA